MSTKGAYRLAELAVPTAGVLSEAQPEGKSLKAVVEEEYYTKQHMRTQAEHHRRRGKGAYLDGCTGPRAGPDFKGVLGGVHHAVLTTAPDCAISAWKDFRLRHLA